MYAIRSYYAFLAEKLGIQLNDIEDFAISLATTFNIDLIIITKGRKGIWAYHKQHGIFSEPGYQIKMVDNVGSGMAFSAGFLHSYNFV